MLGLDRRCSDYSRHSSAWPYDTAFRIGVLPAIVALSVTPCFPIVRNTYVGITGVDQALIEAGIGMGMTSRQLLMAR